MCTAICLGVNWKGDPCKKKRFDFTYALQRGDVPMCVLHVSCLLDSHGCFDMYCRSQVLYIVCDSRKKYPG